MKFLTKTFAGRRKALQAAKSNPNRVLLEIGKDLGFSMPAIRHGLLAINGLKLSGLADEYNQNGSDVVVSVPTLSRALNSKDGPMNIIAMAILAESLGLEVPEIFPTKGTA